MPLGHPDVGEGLPSQSRPQALEERRDILAQLHRVEATLTRVGQRRVSIEPVGDAVAADLRPSATACLSCRALRISVSSRRLGRANANEATAGLRRLGVEAQLPLATQERQARPLHGVLFLVL